GRAGVALGVGLGRVVGAPDAGRGTGGAGRGAGSSGGGARAARAQPQEPDSLHRRTGRSLRRGAPGRLAAPRSKVAPLRASALSLMPSRTRRAGAPKVAPRARPRYRRRAGAGARARPAPT